MNVQIEPKLHWEDNILYWGRLCLVAIQRRESRDAAFYELKGIAFEDWLIDEGGRVWMESDGALRIPDNGNVPEFLAMLYRQILSLADYTASITEQ